jgi:hypothetical protein
MQLYDFGENKMYLLPKDRGEIPHINSLQGNKKSELKL